MVERLRGDGGTVPVSAGRWGHDEGEPVVPKLENGPRDLNETNRQLDDLRDLTDARDRALRDLQAERDRRYEDRFRAQEAANNLALAAQKELTAASFVSSEKAMAKAEAVRERNDRDRDETRAMIEAVRTDVYNLRESRSEGVGRHQQQLDTRLYSNWFMIGMMVIGALSALALVLSVVGLLTKGGG